MKPTLERCTLVQVWSHTLPLEPRGAERWWYAERLPAGVVFKEMFYM